LNYLQPNNLSDNTIALTPSLKKNDNFTFPEIRTQRRVKLLDTDLTEKGKLLNMSEFNNLRMSKDSNNESNTKKLVLKENDTHFEMNDKELVRHKKDYINIRDEKRNLMDCSKESPQWFNALTEESKKNLDEKLKNDGTVFVLSKFQNWITVTPELRNRNQPLEKARVKLDHESKIMPQWMQIQATKPVDPFMKLNMVNHNHKVTLLVEKSQNENKSVFASGDYRHNVFTKEEAKENSRYAKIEEKRYFNWDDQLIFDQKRKRDFFLRNPNQIN